MTDAQISERLLASPEWHALGGRINRTFRFDSFADSIRFINRMAETAESMNHHPNFSVIDKRVVEVVLWTHKLSCLTSLDFDLATTVSGIYNDLKAG